MRDLAHKGHENVVLGDDFVVPDNVGESEILARRASRRLLRKSSLTRKIITFNLIALNILVAGILYLNASRDGLAQQRASGLVAEADLIADVFEVQLPAEASTDLISNGTIMVENTLAGLNMQSGTEVYAFDIQGRLLGQAVGTANRPGASMKVRSTVITDTLSYIWDWISIPFSARSQALLQSSVEDQARALVEGTLTRGTQFSSVNGLGVDKVFSVATRVMQGETPVAVIVLSNTSGEIDNLVRLERERVLQMLLIATVISVVLSLILASTIANPLADLATAAELGGARNNLTGQTGRIRIPDLTARPDEIGRLSGALRGMVAALYHRIEGNEQFAADVAHEIKNPLASLRSVVGTMRVAKRDDQREKLLEVIEHDVRRLDRLVSDISNASRLDSELVKEEQEAFDLVSMLNNLAQYLGEEADKKGIDFLTDFPQEPMQITGLEGRLAQVFVNLITNAISFCEDGDAIRLWIRRRDDRVVIVVEDTGPGIPEQALTKIFQRFYSQREMTDFGNNSGLGLSISKQIVEAHDGVIWAENIRPTEADVTSDPLGARFVVGLPI